MRRYIRHYLHNTSGAVTVDWVVLTAIVVSLGILAAGNVLSGVIDMSSDVQTFLEEH